MRFYYTHHVRSRIVLASLKEWKSIGLSKLFSMQIDEYTVVHMFIQNYLGDENIHTSRILLYYYTHEDFYHTRAVWQLQKIFVLSLVSPELFFCRAPNFSKFLNYQTSVISLFPSNMLVNINLIKASSLQRLPGSSWYIIFCHHFIIGVIWVMKKIYQSLHYQLCTRFEKKSHLENLFSRIAFVSKNFRNCRCQATVSSVYKYVHMIVTKINVN